MQSIFQFHQDNALLATAGQPDEQELIGISENDFQFVINLGLDNAEYSLANEATIVKNLGMTYLHIPVSWVAPDNGSLTQFFKQYAAIEDKKVFIHCAANKRVSVYLMLYRIKHQNWQFQDAMQECQNIWQPNKVWLDFIRRHASAI